MTCNSSIPSLYAFNDKILHLFIYMICSREKVSSTAHINARYMPEIRKKPSCISQVQIKRRIVTLPKNHVIHSTQRILEQTYLTKASRTLWLDFLATYSPIIALSSLGFSFRNVTTSPGSKGSDNNPCSWRKVIPLIGLVLNCSVPV